MNERLVGNLMRDLVRVEPLTEDELLLAALAIDRREIAPIDDLDGELYIKHGGEG